MLKNICLHHAANCRSETEPMSACVRRVIQDVTEYCEKEELPSVIDMSIDNFRTTVAPDIFTWQIRRYFFEALEILQMADEMKSYKRFGTDLNDAVTSSIQCFLDWRAKQFPGIIEKVWQT